MFIAGGLVYTNINKISKIKAWQILSVMSITIVVYYLLNGNVFMCLLVSVVMLLYAITSNVKVLDNKIAKFLSGISMEIYLCHMMVFRILQKMKITNIFGNGWIQYFITVILTLIGAIIFAIIVRKVFEVVESKIK